MSEFEVHDPRFGDLITSHARLEQLWTGARWGAGLFSRRRHLVFSDIPIDRLQPKLGGTPVSTRVRVYREFDVVNRLQGTAGFATTVAFPLAVTK